MVYTGEFMAKYLRRFQNFVKQAITVSLLTFTYYAGIGLTALVGRLTGKQFLPPAAKTGNWVKRTTDGGTETMY
jgi:hypothetical protein